MAPLRFLHAANLHLGRPFAGLSKSLPDSADRFLRAGYKAWERIVKTALDKRVDFVTLAGDVFDNANPALRPRVAFRDGVSRLHEAGIPVFLTLGNHDPLCDFPDALRSLPGLHLFGPEPEGMTFDAPHVDQQVIIYGASFERAATRENLVRRFQRDAAAEIAIGLVHANVSGMPGHDDYAPCSLEDLRRTGMDLWCMGHVHIATILSEYPLILYAGTSQGAHVNETGSRGCYLITVDGPAEALAKFVPVAPVRWEKLEVDLTDISGEEDLLDTLEHECSKLAPDDEDIDAVVARIHLKGQGGGHVLALAHGASELTEMLGERLARLPVPVFAESIRDATVSTIDLNSLMNEGGLLADFLKLCREAPDDPHVKEEIIGELQSELAKHQYQRYLDPALLPARLNEDPETFAAFLRDVEERVTRMFFEGVRK
jgi:exonuclease SbcD